MSPSEKLVVLAAGGTGGHVFPAEALATEMTGRGFKLSLITDRRGDAYGGALGSIETHRVRAGGIAGKSISALLRSGPELAFGTLQARFLLKKMRPRAVVGFGGYASVPTMLAATFGGCKTVIHEQNAVLGRANRLLASRVKRIATSFEGTRSVPDSAMAKVIQTGMPVRQTLTAVRGTAYPELNDSSEINILVLGGSQGANILSEVIPEAIGRLDADLRARLSITQQCRPEDLEAARANYRQLSIKAELESFFDDIPERLAATHLLISRAGASSVAEAMTVGRPAILVPYPHAVDDHQTFNAHALDDAGGGWLMAQETFTPEALAERLSSLLHTPRVLTRAAACARTAGRPDAVVRLADTICELIETNGQSNDGRRAA
ncbi:MAG: undecaprenyldiphospho-muramoylpentapeptide beta-N-acetylglucosaminyltransferase [Rhodospirillaceae bacterium]|nr:undecaprenyldiphospho-muramoylpentapeptide beta-N-acetylglucosaminyltransferase [Rhodospirillaceae bacterium]MBT5245078.1 undecaprenyldiphospho-muramoylpentapeptide beta-N-acetylglucosaminyltransferase [Rhodospirillaceae bacterium]MBT5562304.1 undecaprenyldiphospho-muramoylpentapeptide beta-N-acetylglucosaminyltransferase [Rhodospirillaceae bacterium]MBT6242705.1 undecaprenyldiphospho-muramoylpentapeptide beta-N-acetylglucosaminyltransferase [Rhodospirillaceae bacterium]MBT7137577.1 undecapr